MDKSESTLTRKPFLVNVKTVATLLAVVVSFVLGITYDRVGARFTLLSNKNTTVALPPTKEDRLIKPTASSTADRWVKTGLMGRGIVFEYPLGWHVAGGVTSMQLDMGQEGGYDAYLVSRSPIILATGEGPLTDILISVQNGLQDPFGEFENKRKAIKANLDDVYEEILPSEYFSPVYHITGKISHKNEYAGGYPVNTYIFMSTNEKYVSPDLINRNIIVVDVKSSDKAVRSMLTSFISRFKECDWIFCEEIFK